MYQISDHPSIRVEKYDTVCLGLNISPDSTCVYGYSNKRVSLTRLAGIWTWSMLFPEIRRRNLAMWFAHPGTIREGYDSVGRPILRTDMGIGEGARDPAVQEAEFKRRRTTEYLPGRPYVWYEGQRWYLLPGMAPITAPGNSVHNPDAIGVYAAAADLVGWQDHWADLNCHRFGLKNFGGAFGPNVNDEEWHYQDESLPNSRSALIAEVNRRLQASLPALEDFPLPGHQTATRALASFGAGSAPNYRSTTVIPLNVRLFDSRVFTPLRDGVPVTMKVPLDIGVPKEAVGVMVNLTATRPSADRDARPNASWRGHLKAWAHGDPPKDGSVLNFNPLAGDRGFDYDADGNPEGGFPIFNTVFVELAPDNTFSLMSVGSDTEIIVDIQAYSTPAV